MEQDRGRLEPDDHAAYPQRRRLKRIAFRSSSSMPAPAVAGSVISTTETAGSAEATGRLMVRVICGIPIDGPGVRRET